jgi:hypothetical protein
VTGVDKTLKKMREAPTNVRFIELLQVCEAFFGAARHSGTSHVVFATPWAGDPRVNIQKGEGGKAKPYQVRQVLAAIDKLNAVEGEES